MKTIKILHITHDLNIGGLQNLILNICKYSDSKYIFEVLCLRDLGALVSEFEKIKVKVFLLKQEDKIDYLSFFKVANFLKKNKYDIIHTHNTHPLIDGMLGKLISNTKSRVIHTDHGRIFPDKKRYMLAEHLLSKFIHKFIAVSEDAFFKLKYYEKILPEKLQIIENGVDGRKFDVTIDVNRKKDEIGINSGVHVIGVISRLEKVKGIDYLIEAMPDILCKFPKLQLLIVGDGSEGSKLMSLCQKLNLQDSVLFLGPRLDIPELFQILDVFLLPSLSEGMPLGLIEAMAARRPIVASNVGGIPSVVIDSVSAVLVPPKNSKQIFDAVIKILSNQKFKNYISNNAFNHFIINFEIKSMIKKYNSLYNECF